jgi:hypothetical protein
MAMAMEQATVQKNAGRICEKIVFKKAIKLYFHLFTITICRLYIDTI